MADLHPKVEALFKTSPTCSHGNYCEADVRRIALRQQELEREECAKVCEARATYWRESVAEGTEVDGYESQILDKTATIIRQRGKP